MFRYFERRQSIGEIKHQVLHRRFFSSWVGCNIATLQHCNFQKTNKGYSKVQQRKFKRPKKGKSASRFEIYVLHSVQPLLPFPLHRFGNKRKSIWIRIQYLENKPWEEAVFGIKIQIALQWGGRGATFYSVGKIAKKNSATSSQIFSCYPRSLLVARFFCATHVHCQNEWEKKLCL